MMGQVFVLLLIFLLGGIAGGTLAIVIVRNRLAHYFELSDKHKQIMDIFKIWFIFLEEGNRIEDFFIRNNYKKIAIYGMGYLGKRLFSQLEKTKIEIRYIIDQNSGAVYGTTPTLSLEDEWAMVDVIVVTPVYYFYEIKSKIQKKGSFRVISIEEIFSGK